LYVWLCTAKQYQLRVELQPEDAEETTDQYGRDDATHGTWEYDVVDVCLSDKENEKNEFAQLVPAGHRAAGLPLVWLDAMQAGQHSSRPGQGDADDDVAKRTVSDVHKRKRDEASLSSCEHVARPPLPGEDIATVAAISRQVPCAGTNTACVMRKRVRRSTYLSERLSVPWLGAIPDWFLDEYNERHDDLRRNKLEVQMQQVHSGSDAERSRPGVVTQEIAKTNAISLPQNYRTHHVVEGSNGSHGAVRIASQTSVDANPASMLVAAASMPPAGPHVYATVPATYASTATVDGTAPPFMSQQFSFSRQVQQPPSTQFSVRGHTAVVRACPLPTRTALSHPSVSTASRPTPQPSVYAYNFGGINANNSENAISFSSRAAVIQNKICSFIN